MVKVVVDRMYFFNHSYWSLYLRIMLINLNVIAAVFKPDLIAQYNVNAKKIFNNFNFTEAFPT